MTFHDASKEFELDCKVRHLSPKTIGNYTKQLRYLENHLSSEFSILNIEDVKPAHIKSFMAMMDDAGRKPQYINDGALLASWGRVSLFMSLSANYGGRR